MNRGTRPSRPTEGWDRIVHLVGETFDTYLAGLPLLRRRIVAKMRRRLKEGDVLDHRGGESSPRAKKRP